MTKRKASSRKPSQNSRRTVRKGRRRSSSRWKIYLLGGTIGLLILSGLLALTGWVGYEAGRESALKECAKEVDAHRRDLEKLRQKLEKSRRSATTKEKPAQKVATQKSRPSEVRDYVEAGGQVNLPPPSEKRTSPDLKRPRLVIIIDDVAFASQLKAIRKLPWHITPSIFPPTPRHPETPKIAATLEHYMIHLPMEALRYNNPEEDTLTIHSDEKAMESRIRHLRRWFPKARFINNHTGSRFTSDSDAMRRLYPILRRYDFVFVDSRTTPGTVVPGLCKRYGTPYLALDIFLDNESDKEYIRNQLKKAVRLAKSRGYAIAIGHPHRSTIQALAASGDILEGVEVVYIDELYEKIR